MLSNHSELNVPIMSKDKALATNTGRSSNINLIRFLWVDYCGLVHCKGIPLSLFGNPVRMVQAAMTLVPWGAMARGVTAATTGELQLVPVVGLTGTSWREWQVSGQSIGHLPSRLELPWHPNHKVAIAKMLNSKGEPWEQCPKSALIRAVELLKEKDLNVKAGFELEFVLFTVDPANEKELLPFGRGGHYSLHDQFDIAASFMDDAISCLEQMKIPVRLVHAEAGPGQYEIVLGHKDILDAAHDLVVARLAIKAVARKHRLVASFVPSSGEGLPGSGCHVHLSLDGHFGTDDELRGKKIGVSQTGQKFMAGILNDLPWLMFLLNCSPLSYARSQPQFWVGVYQIWGDNNKEAPLRLVEDRSNFEIKLLDGISNADIALTGVLLAGLRGIEENKELPEPCQTDPHLIDGKDRPKLLPLSLEKSLEEFNRAYKGNRLKEIFTDEMVEDLMKVKREEIEYVKKSGLAAYRKLLLTLH